MRIDKSQIIGGYSIVKLRNFLKKHDEYIDSNRIKRFFEISDKEVKEFLNLLLTEEYLETVDKFNHKDELYRKTEKALRLASSSLLKPIKREKADKLLATLLERVDIVKKEDQYLLYVGYLSIFGSYITEKGELGDLDLIIELKRKEKFASDWLEHTLSQASNSGKRFGSFFDRLGYSEKKVFDFLKKRSPYLHFSSKEEAEQMGIESKVLISEN